MRGREDREKTKRGRQRERYSQCKVVKANCGEVEAEEEMEKVDNCREELRGTEGRTKVKERKIGISIKKEWIRENSKKIA